MINRLSDLGELYVFIIVIFNVIKNKTHILTSIMYGFKFKQTTRT